MGNFGKKFESIVFYEVSASVNEVFVAQLVILNVPEQDLQNPHHLSSFFPLNFLIVEVLYALYFLGL